MKKTASLYRVELRRLFRTRLTGLAVLLCMASPAAGYWIKDEQGIVSNQYIAFPVMAGSLIGALIWALFTIFESDRPYRSGAAVLTDAVASPAALYMARTLAMGTLAMGGALVTMLAQMPYAYVKMAYLFQKDFYMMNYLALMLPTWWASILMACAFYLLTQRTELSLILYAGMAVFACVSSRGGSYFKSWIMPRIITYSDGFVSLWPLRINAYTRLLWLCFLAGIFLVSLLCIRRYQRGILYSFGKARRKALVLAPALLLVLAGSLLWVYQPFIDKGPAEYDVEADLAKMMEAQNPLAGSFGDIRLELKTHPALGTIEAKIQYADVIPAGGESVLKLNPGYRIRKMTYDEKEIAFRTVKDDINGERSTYFTIPNVRGKTLEITYGGMPTQAGYHAAYSVFESVDRSYVSLQAESLFPLLPEYDMNGKMTAEFTLPEKLVAFLDNQQMTDSTDNGDGSWTWRGVCNVGAIQEFTAGPYRITPVQAGNLTLDFAYGDIYEEIVQKSDAKQMVQKVFSYCSEHYGELMWARANHMLLLQKSSMLMGGWAGEGYSQWFEVVLSPETLKDKDRGSNATEVFIHEMVHQWWGALGLDCKEEDVWSCEGLTVYSTYRIVKELYGDAYARQYYVEAWKKAVEEQNRNFYNRHPEYLDRLPEQYRARINQSNQGINHYARMPLMLLRAEELLGGEEQMDAVLSRIFADKELFAMEEGDGFGYQDFLEYCGLREEDLALE